MPPKKKPTPLANMSLAGTTVLISAAVLRSGMLGLETVKRSGITVATESSPKVRSEFAKCSIASNTAGLIVDVVPLCSSAVSPLSCNF